jgi:hypothetical protein
VPVEHLGSGAYVVIRGFAAQNATNCDRVFILATRNNTRVSINGVDQPVMSAGQQIVQSMETVQNDPTATIVSDSSIYVYQLSGYGASGGGTELGAVLLPSMYSIGSRRIMFYKKPARYNHSVMVLVRAGSEGHFTVNGDANVLTAADFNTIPNVPDWKYARKNISSVANGFVDVANSTGAFSLGYFFTGASGGSSASFGYFSAFGDFDFPGGGITWLCGSSTVLAGGYAKSYKWFFNGEEIVGATGPSLTVTQEGIYKVEMDQDGTTVTATTEVKKVKAGTISASQHICTGAIPAELTVTGSAGDIFQWQGSPTGLDGSWTDIPNAFLPAYTPGPLTQTTYYRRGTAASGQCPTVYSGSTEVKVSPCTVPVNPHLRTHVTH